MSAERRDLHGAVELRALEGKTIIRGYAYVFNRLSQDLGGFRERIDPGAGRADMEHGDLVATFNHDFGKPLGRTGYGLRTGLDDVGGWYEIDLPDTTAGRDVADLIERRIISGSSFRFRLGDSDADQEWTRDDATGELIRTLRDFRVTELGPVTTPAYPDTTAALRSIPVALQQNSTASGRADGEGDTLTVTTAPTTATEERAHAEHALQAVADDQRAEMETRILARLDELDARIAGQEAEERARETRDAVLALLDEHNVIPMQRPGSDDNRALRSLREGGATEFRAMMGVTVDAANKQAGKATPLRSLYSTLLQLIGERSYVIAAGARVLQTTSGEAIDFPRVRPVRPTVKTNEGAPLPENYPATDTVPLGVEKYGYVSHVSVELVQDDAVDLVDFLAADAAPNLADQMGHDFTAALLNPTTGILPELRTTITGTNIKDAQITDAVIDTYYSLPTFAARRATWITGRKSIARLRKLKDNDGTYLLKSISDGGVLVLMGQPLELDPAFSGANEHHLALSDLSGFTVRYAGPLRVARSTEVKFIEDLVSFKFVQRAGGALIDTTGSALLTLPSPPAP
ncbi:phage major capsid protein [Allokutzneria sp. A3M-2-11 16]|uniref:phage major capsid protein n=1 Tax=Allokutzneria sp. A3M-2-11 16 TaxID=2962043 RepID=UPI0020B70F5A|nr:phage major capsid protein [Allokutzneria sp. A3M-2-11 16]MCP3800194.1 phage major capsid protein [Allokutzneria sp. A3M-2-11 16]